MTTAMLTLEERVTALEQAVAELKQQRPRGHRAWLDKISGSITDPEAFAEVLRIGREYRQADREPEPAEDGP